MNKVFQLERSVFLMMAILFVIGLVFVLVRSDLLRTYAAYQETDFTAVEQDEAVLNTADPFPSYLILTDDSSKVLEEAVTDRLHRMGMNVETRLISDRDSEYGDVYEGVIIVTEDLNSMKSVSGLLDYVKSGGDVFLATRPSPGAALMALYQPLGMIEAGGFVETTGITMASSFFDSQPATAFSSEELRNSSLAVRLSPAAEVIAFSSDNLPLMWKTSYGNGRFLVFNGSILTDSDHHALFIEGVRAMTPDMIYPVVNRHVSLLEGFPFPVAAGDYEKNGTRMTYSDYYRSVFWPEMQKTGAKYGLRYTAAYVASFDDEVEVFDEYVRSNEMEDAERYGRELVRMGGEMAFQGYSPSDESDDAELDKKFDEVKKRLEHALPDYPILSYIPSPGSSVPKNLESAITSFPELQAVVSNENQLTTAEGVSHFPRTISGFELNELDRWKALNGLLVSGYIGHSLEPQRLLADLEQEEWIGEFNAFQSDLEKMAPWLSRSTLSQAVRSVEQYSSATLYRKLNGAEHTFYLSHLRGPAYYFFSSDRSIVSTENCKVERVGEGLYLVEATDVTFTIHLEGSE